MALARIVVALVVDVVVEFHQPVAAVDIDRSIDHWDRSRLVVALVVDVVVVALVVVVVDNVVDGLRSRDCPDDMRL